MQEGGGNNSDIHKGPSDTDKEPEINKAATPDREIVLGSKEFYKNKMEKGFEIIDEIVNEREPQKTYKLDGINFNEALSQVFDVALTGEDK